MVDLHFSSAKVFFFFALPLLYIAVHFFACLCQLHLNKDQIIIYFFESKKENGGKKSITFTSTKTNSYLQNETSFPIFYDRTFNSFVEIRHFFRIPRCNFPWFRFCCRIFRVFRTELVNSTDMVKEVWSFCLSCIKF